jgi:cytochrome b
MARVLIWDLPTRLFHWLLGAGFAGAAGIAFLLDEDSGLYPYHAILGLAIAFMVALRVVWGFVGTRHARFRSFVFGPGAVLGYLRGVVTGTGAKHTGHNPASAYAIFAIFALLGAQATTGVMLATGNGGVKELHELIAYALLGVVGAHIVGVVLHTLRYRENITGSMVHGRKDAADIHAIASARPVVGVVFLVLTGGWLGALFSSYDGATRTARLPLLGTTLSLGEAEDEGGGEGHEADRDQDEDDD